MIKIKNRLPNLEGGLVFIRKLIFIFVPNGFSSFWFYFKKVFVSFIDESKVSRFHLLDHSGNYQFQNCVFLRKALSQLLSLMFPKNKTKRFSEWRGSH